MMNKMYSFFTSMPPSGIGNHIKRHSLCEYTRARMDSIPGEGEQTRKTSLSQTRDSKKRRKSSTIGQHKSTTVMTDSDEADVTESNNCVNCDAQKSTDDRRCDLGSDYLQRKHSDGSMAFSAIVVGGGGGIRHTRSRVSLDELNGSDGCGKCTRNSSLIARNTETVTINVGGQVFETYKSTLSRLLSCKLSMETEMRKHYRESRGDYFFDRDPQIFCVVLNYLRTGELHLPTYLCGPAVQREFDYWGIEENDIERCCWQPYNTWKTQNRSLEKLEYDRKRSTTQRNLERDRRSSHCWTRWKAIVWNFLQDPNFSVGAKVYAWMSIIFVFLSIFSFCAETHPIFRVSSDSEIVEDYGRVYQLFTLQNLRSSKSSVVDKSVPVNISNENGTRTNETEVRTVPHPALVVMDLICVSFFTLEFITRFAFCPSKRQFITALQNIIDFIAILPDYIEFLLKIADSDEDLPFMDFIFILRILRLCRIFRLIRHVPGLWILLYTLKASFNELLLMFVFLLIGMVIFASLIHFVEEDNGFDNIPVGFWWSVITMTTVGYGDMHPRSAFGYVIGSLCAISGLLMIAFTVPIIVSNFVLYYTHVQYGIARHEKEKTKLLDVSVEAETDVEENSLSYVECKGGPTCQGSKCVEDSIAHNPTCITDGNFNRV